MNPLTPSLSPSDGEKVPDSSAVALAKAEGRLRGIPTGAWHRTTNAEHRMAARILPRFGVRYSMLDVQCFPFPHSLTLPCPAPKFALDV